MTINSNTAIADVIDDSADLIEKTRWWNPRKGIGIGLAYCPVTAMRHSAPLDVVSLWEESSDAFSRSIGCSSMLGIPEWNDSFDNPQPVLDAMRKCAKELRALDDLG